MSRSRTAIALVTVLLGATAVAIAVLPGDTRKGGGTLRDPIDRHQQTALAFGQRSHWLQPWRAYLDTPPATRLRDAIGINFNVEPSEAEATARLLHDSGFRRARVEIGWDQIAFDEPPRLADPARFEALVGALVRNGIRPLILLNANHGVPGPTRFLDARLAGPAARGAREVNLAPGTARKVVPGRTGLNDESGKAADVLFTRVARDGTATLSKPLARRLGAGAHPAATLRYEPFGPPQLEDGRPNPKPASVHAAAGLFSLDELLEHPVVDYLVGAEPAPGVFVLGYEEHPVQRALLDLYKLGEGPLYTFYRRGWYMTYGLCENTPVVESEGLLPVGLAEGCRLTRDVKRDEVVTYADVEPPPGRLGHRLREEQSALFPAVEA